MSSDNGNGKLKVGFENEEILLPLSQLLPTKMIVASTKQSKKYATILASIREVGLVEPPVVYPAKTPKGKEKSYLILDGHIRVDCLKQLGHTEVYCLISTDDEGFTYNHKVNRLATIQEHFMIVRAIEHGVSEERIAKALDVDVGRITRQRDLLKGICPESVAMLRDKPISAGALRQLRKVKPLRQIEIAELVIGAGNYSSPYVSALVFATPPSLVEAAYQTSRTVGVAPEDIAKIQREVEALEQGIKDVEGSYGPNMMHLVLARGYLAKLVANARVRRFLSTHHAEMLGEFDRIVEAASLE